MERPISQILKEARMYVKRCGDNFGRKKDWARQLAAAALASELQLLIERYVVAEAKPNVKS